MVNLAVGKVVTAKVPKQEGKPLGVTLKGPAEAGDTSGVFVAKYARDASPPLPLHTHALELSLSHTPTHQHPARAAPGFYTRAPTHIHSAAFNHVGRRLRVGHRHWRQSELVSRRDGAEARLPAPAPLPPAARACARAKPPKLAPR